MDSMPWVAPDDIEYEFEARSVCGCARSCRREASRRLDLFEIEPADDPLPASPQDEAAKALIRPALCVEAREGRLHVFLPYMPKLADYLDLVAAVEDTCRYLQNAGVGGGLYAAGRSAVADRSA